MHSVFTLLEDPLNLQKGNRFSVRVSFACSRGVFSGTTLCSWGKKKSFFMKDIGSPTSSSFSDTFFLPDRENKYVYRFWQFLKEIGYIPAKPDRNGTVAGMKIREDHAYIFKALRSVLCPSSARRHLFGVLCFVFTLIKMSSERLYQRNLLRDLTVN